jgi:hypothetical protein
VERAGKDEIFITGAHHMLRDLWVISDQHVGTDKAASDKCSRLSTSKNPRRSKRAIGIRADRRPWFPRG